jgi:HSP20 family protein|tara:strand:- start:139 stop:570 length:432 start_codon:yes stop_codon:yes gene_type:complete
MTHVNLFDPGFASPLDVLVKNFFDKDAIFDKPSRQAVTHPIDVFEDHNGLTFEVACVGLDKKDVNISIEGDILKVSHKKGEQQQSTEDKRYYHTGVRKSSFDFGWKVARRFNLSKANAEMKNGLLCILIPYATEAKPKTLTIK